MKTSYMNNILVKALMNGIISWTVIALYTTLVYRDIALSQAFLALPTICTAAACGVASYIGFKIRET